MQSFGVGILAGGKSERMGRNKALLLCGGVPLLERIAREFSDGEVLISAAASGEYEHFGLRVVCDGNRGIGPIEGIRRVLTESAHEWMFLCAADMPNLRRELAAYLAEFICSDYDCIIVTDGGRIQPLCGLYSKRVLPVLAERIAAGRYRLSEVLERARTKYVPLEYTCFDARVLENINTPRDYARLSAPHVFCVCGLKNSGKTTLVCRLTEAFRRDGCTVAVLKHDGHDCFAPAAGTDTARFIEAGASCSAIFTDTRFALTARGALTPETLIEQIRRMPQPPDVLIVEGLKASHYPKIELLRGADGKSVCSGAPPMLYAVEGEPPAGLSACTFCRDDVAGIYARLRQELGMGGSGYGE